MLGLKRNTVALYPHETQWEQIAQETIHLLCQLLRDASVDIQHVGSTAIRSICAKPIIDLAVGVHSFDEITPLIPLLEHHGIIYRGRDNGGQLFVMGDFRQDTRTHHIHVVIWNGTEWNDYIRFRNRLNTCPDAAKEYEALKKQLACKYAEDREAYTKGKHDLIQRLLSQTE